MAATADQVARLAAGAQGGTAGVQAYDEAQGQVKANRDQALQGLQQSSSELGAPSALTSQLQGDIEQPASVALGNLATLGATQQAADLSGTAALGNYMSEANAALPLIRGEDDRNLAQQIALLNAQRAHSSGGGGGGAGSLTDAELRTRLLGAAEGQRQSLLQSATDSFNAQVAAAKNELAYSRADQPEIPLQPLKAGVSANPADLASGGANLSTAREQQLNARRNAIFTTQTGQAKAREDAFANLKNAAYGPGITDEAQQIGLQNGIDPSRVEGLLTPQDDAAYVDANKRLGLYKDPTQASITGQTLDLPTAVQQFSTVAKTLGLPPDQQTLDPHKVAQIYNKTDFVFSDPTSKTNKGFQSFLTQNGAVKPTGSTYTAADGQNYDLSDPAQLAKAQQAFMAQPNAQQYAEPIIGNVLADAKRAVDSGLDFDTWVGNLRSTPEFRYDPQSFVLGFIQAQPLFQYSAALHSRQTSAPADTVVDPSLSGS